MTLRCPPQGGAPLARHQRRATPAVTPYQPGSQAPQTGAARAAFLAPPLPSSRPPHLGRPCLACSRRCLRRIQAGTERPMSDREPPLMPAWALIYFIVTLTIGIALGQFDVSGGHAQRVMRRREAGGGPQMSPNCPINSQRSLAAGTCQPEFRGPAWRSRRQLCCIQACARIGRGRTDQIG